MLWGREPNLWAGAIRAVLLTLTAFGLQWTGEQVATFMFAVEAILTLLTRASVTSNVKASRQQIAAYDAGREDHRHAVQDAMADDGRRTTPRPLLLALLAALTLSSACALLPKPGATPADEQARLNALNEAVSHVVTATKIARGAQDLTVALRDTLSPQLGVQLATAFKVYFSAADEALATAQDQAVPFATRQAALFSVVRAAQVLLAELDLFAPLSSMRDALGDQIARTQPALQPES